MSFSYSVSKSTRSSQYPKLTARSETRVRLAVASRWHNLLTAHISLRTKLGWHWLSCFIAGANLLSLSLFRCTFCFCTSTHFWGGALFAGRDVTLAKPASPKKGLHCSLKLTPVLGMKVKHEMSVIWLFLKITLWIIISMESSRQDAFIDNLWLFIGLS